MLVSITEMNKKEILTVSSREVAEDFEKQHKHVLESINNMKEQMSTAEFSALFIESAYKASNGKTNKEYLVTRDGFSLLVMSFTGSKALEWKLKYIQAFGEMEKELKRLYEERKKWEIERAKGMMIRHVLTDTIKMKIPESPHKKFMYPNYTKLIYKVLYNKSLKELREQYGVKGKESIRDYIPAEELREVESLEMLVSSLISLGMGYDEIKEFIVSKASALLAG